MVKRMSVSGLFLNEPYVGTQFGKKGQNNKARIRVGITVKDDGFKKANR
jgi:hypothetical protein